VHRDIRKCVAFEFKCQQTWDALALTDRNDVRHCTTCDHQVYYCQTDADMIAHAEAGHCVARRVPLTPWSFVNMVGRPELSATPQERVGLRRDGLEHAKTLALQAEPGLERCAQCGFPTHPGGRCAVCLQRERLAEVDNGDVAVVRLEEPGDVAEIHAVHVASFPTDAEARLVSLLRASGRLSLSLLAEVASEVVGHVAFSPVSTATSAVGAGLGPVAVLESHRRRGIAAQLIQIGLAACRSAKVGWVVVLGDPAYYARFGFRPASTFGLSDEFRGGSAFQVVELISGTLPRGAGLVRYAAEFASLG